METDLASVDGKAASDLSTLVVTPFIGITVFAAAVVEGLCAYSVDDSGHVLVHVSVLVVATHC